MQIRIDEDLTARLQAVASERNESPTDVAAQFIEAGVARVEASKPGAVSQFSYRGASVRAAEKKTAEKSEEQDAVADQAE